MTKQEIEKLRKDAHTILTLPDMAQKMVKRYQTLSIQGVTVPCPYHINCGLHAKDRALVGKGRPEEIEHAAEHYLQRYQMDAHDDAERLTAYLLACGIGVDCSGFAAWVLDAVTQEQLHKPIWRCLTFPTAKRKLISAVRPLESISANLLTGKRNTHTITDLRRIRPSDMLRLIHGGHVVVVSTVGLNNRGEAFYFEYVQSTTSYGGMRGIDEGVVVLTQPEGALVDQHWSDPLIYKDVVASADDTRVVRLSCLYKN